MAWRTFLADEGSFIVVFEDTMLANVELDIL
jgi:hypothetical protein